MALQHKLLIDHAGPFEFLQLEIFRCMGKDFEQSARELPNGRWTAENSLMTVSTGSLTDKDAELDCQQFGFRPTIYASISASSEYANEAETQMIRGSVRFIIRNRPLHLGVFRYWESIFLLYEKNKISLVGVNPAMYNAALEELGGGTGINLEASEWFGV